MAGVKTACIFELMSGTASAPRILRLVGATAEPPIRASEPRSAPTRPVWAENHSAAKLSAMDARWVLAARTSQLLEGGQVALLAPRSRRLLVRLGSAMGLRAFDSALVIAIAQDAARAGEPLTRSAQDRLAMVRPASNASKVERLETVGLLIAAFLLGGLFFTIVRVWLLG